MIERAKEELDMLEKQHPHRFDYLKLELRSFISLLQSQQFVEPSPSTSTATTQASTSMKRRKRASMKRRKEEEDDERWGNNNSNKKITVMRRGEEERDRVDVALEKAQACLRKIQDFKFSLQVC